MAWTQWGGHGASGALLRRYGAADGRVAYTADPAGRNPAEQEPAAGDPGQVRGYFPWSLCVAYVCVSVSLELCPAATSV